MHAGSKDGPRKLKRVASKVNTYGDDCDEMDLEEGIGDGNKPLKRKSAKNRKKDLEPKSLQRTPTKKKIMTSSQSRKKIDSPDGSCDSKQKKSMTKKVSNHENKRERKITSENAEQARRTKKIGDKNLRSKMSKEKSILRNSLSDDHNGKYYIDSKEELQSVNRKISKLRRGKSSVTITDDTTATGMDSSGETVYSRNKVKNNRPSTGRSRSEAPLTRKKSEGLVRQESRKKNRSQSTKSTSTLTRERSKEQIHGIRSRQAKREEFQRSKSVTTGHSLQRGKSMNRSLANVGYKSTELSRRGYQRSKSHRPTGVDRRRNGTSLSRSSLSRSSLSRSRSRSRSALRRSRSVLSVSDNGPREIFYDEHGRRLIRDKVDTEKLPRTLVIIWVMVAAELGFDFATTIIAFLSFLKEANCCDKTIELVVGNVPFITTIPFFVLVMVELVMLIRVIVMTLWPKASSTRDDDIESIEQSTCRRCCCYCLKMKAKGLMGFMNYLVLLNPVFGCLIAWMLMYQSDKTEAFTVLGLEGASLILHFASVCLEGSFRTCRQITFHSLPLIPFFVSIGMVGYYLKQGGVCYIPKEKIFRFSGCEICPNPQTGVFEPCPKDLFEWSGGDMPNSLDGIWDEITGRTTQSTYCSADINFCFFDYDSGT
ncbi:MAG: hypothetical protein ACI8RD_011584 [Bacillariaceae sp.]|jgi:hypothetical protein